MSARFCTGLVVGKFAPLHLGHEYLLSEAMAACDALIILSYARPDMPGYEAWRRESWLRARFPAADIAVFDEDRLGERCKELGIAPLPMPDDKEPGEEQRRFVAWLCKDVLQKTVDAVFTSEDYGDPFAQVLAQCQGRPVRHVCVDKERKRFAVSGTRIRRNPHAFREYLSPDVYAGFVRRICILGGESSGKTALAAALAEALGTSWACEYGRELWESRDGKLELADMLPIAETQIAREAEMAKQAQAWLICDTSPLTTLFYSHEMFGKADERLERLARRSYDLTLLCLPDFEFVQDGTRRGPEFRMRQHQWYVANLAARKIEYHAVGGSVASRVETVLGRILIAD